MADGAGVRKAAGDDKTPNGIDAGYIVYQQIAGVFGALSLIAFLGHFVHVDWRGTLLKLIDVWNGFIRPSTEWIVESVTYPLTRMGWHVDLSLLQRDYLSAGIVMSLSYTRAVPKFFAKSSWSAGVFSKLSTIVVGALSLVLIWPLAIVYCLDAFIRGRTWDDADNQPENPRLFGFLLLSPLLYLALLLAANYLLLKS
ncbi:MAG: hypothetical protein ACREHE_05065 [Rhizomicrobium sp.]